MLTNEEKEELDKLVKSQVERGNRTLALKNDTAELSKFLMTSIKSLGNNGDHKPTEQEIKTATERAKTVSKTMDSLNNDETTHRKQFDPLEKKLIVRGAHSFFKELVDTDKQMSASVDEQIQKTKKILAGIDQVKSLLK